MPQSLTRMDFSESVSEVGPSPEHGQKVCPWHPITKQGVEVSGRCVKGKKETGGHHQCRV